MMKKEYVKPEMELIELGPKTALLQSSEPDPEYGDDFGMTFPKDGTNVG